MKIGILGGTFDPPHIGHLIIAEEVRIALELAEVWFIPTNQPPHKENATVTATMRFEMLEIAIQTNPYFKVNQIELNRTGKSYTFDTIESLKKQYPEAEFYFIIGADMIEYLPKWYRIDDLIELITFIGVNRSNYKIESQYPFIPVKVPMIDVSSTLIRSRIANNQTVKYLIPDNVYEYIKEQRLYGSE